ncbi:ComEA family DNA-binding protein [Micrococcus luteus]|uniref:ComEA family DNA-binding protein n=1 Tax=Micrococcus TaxID=1269 RepID=UPI0013D8DBE8|nr:MULTISPECIES: ComEA family DNA-binding protein [Micrococcus]MCK6213108.1 ComEA family DNA-binding protein [Micrococcus luteus]MCV7455523.1 ComEA family DNA-binding protein [Micrococcus luteus]MCV7498340.1 ComEA family DNA-binding protein [Micrococcus luteus]MCV7555405.1 ComEA family DNA-binding protein [Micrococcus luteus]
MSPSHRLCDDPPAFAPDPAPSAVPDVDTASPHAASRWERTPPRGPVLRWRPALLAVTVLLVAATAWWAVAWLTTPAPPSAIPAAAAGAGIPQTDAPSTAPSAAGTDARTPEAGPSGETSGPAGSGPLRVHVVGEVARPGVVSLAPGSRVADAVRAAGGTTRHARAERINLAAPLDDGQQVLVPSAHTPQDALDRVAGAAQAQPTPTTGRAGAGGEPGGAESGDTVDLNTADATELQTLPGVGPATAEKIIAHRETVGPFTGLQDLDAVPGIGPATLDRLRDHVSW